MLPKEEEKAIVTLNEEGEDQVVTSECYGEEQLGCKRKAKQKEKEEGRKHSFEERFDQKVKCLKDSMMIKVVFGERSKFLSSLPRSVIDLKL